MVTRGVTMVFNLYIHFSQVHLLLSVPPLI